MTNILHTRLLLFCFMSFSVICSLHAQNNALNFDGVNDRVNCGNFLPTSYTKEAWIYVTNLGDDNNIVSGSSSSSHVFWVNNSQIAAGHNGSYDQAKGGPTLVINTWYHVAVTYDASTTTMRLYLNGALVVTNTAVATATGAGFVQIGNFDVGDYAFAGSIDEVRIWSVARTQAQIAENMSKSYTAGSPNLIANYRCNQGTASGDNTSVPNLIDDSGNNHSGSFSGLTLNGASSNFVLSGISVLAVELVGFQAIALKNTTELRWQTAYETDNKGFQIERLNLDNNQWETLGFVASKGKAAPYVFTDNTPLSINYYRLRQMDYDGKETLSKVVSIAMKPLKSLTLYPTIAEDKLNLEAADGDFHIFNLLGRCLLTGKTAPQINVSALPKGVYILKVGAEQARFMKL